MKAMIILITIINKKFLKGKEKTVFGIEKKIKKLFDKKDGKIMKKK